MGKIKNKLRLISHKEERWMATSSLVNYVPCTTYYSGGGGGGLVVKSHTALVTPWIITHKAPLSLGFPRGKNTGVGLHFLLREIFPTQGSNPCLCIAGGFFTDWVTKTTVICLIKLKSSCQLYYSSFIIPQKGHASSPSMCLKFLKYVTKYFSVKDRKNKFNKIIWVVKLDCS